METVHAVARMQGLGATWKKAGLTIGLVPTMGCLHAGHAALIDTARRAVDRLVVSIFVNPTQFGPGEDYAVYPRTPEDDLACCRVRGVDVVFMPEVADMYAPDASVALDENRLSKGLCGATRPGHFRGVLTVVAKLFNIVQPDLAVFGRKDAQQTALIVRMTRDLNMPVRIDIHPTVREPDGLALSSRNRYLSADQRRQASRIYWSLERARTRIAAGEIRAAAIVEGIRADLKRAAPDGEPEYVAAVDAESLQPLTQLTGRFYLAVAFRFGPVRLIDNIIVNG